MKAHPPLGLSTKQRAYRLHQSVWRVCSASAYNVALCTVIHIFVFGAIPLGGYSDETGFHFLDLDRGSDHEHFYRKVPATLYYIDWAYILVTLVLMIVGMGDHALLRARAKRELTAEQFEELYPMYNWFDSPPPT